MKKSYPRLASQNKFINMENKKGSKNQLKPNETNGKDKIDETQESEAQKKIQIPRPGIVVHPNAPQRLNVDGEPIVGPCCG